MNTALVMRLADLREAGKLLSIVLSLNRSIAAVNLGDFKPKVNMLDIVNYGTNNPVSMRIIFNFLEEPKNNPRKVR